MATDTADPSVLRVVETGEIREHRRSQALKLLVVKMTRHAEPIVTLLGGESREEEETKEGRPDDACGPECQAPR